jgi:hypothetical protein
MHCRLRLYLGLETVSSPKFQPYGRQKCEFFGFMLKSLVDLLFEELCNGFAKSCLTVPLIWAELPIKTSYFSGVLTIIDVNEAYTSKTVS